MMWSPGLTLTTPAPTSSTMPAASCPRTMGSGSCQSPFMMCQSLWQTPAALTRTRASPACGPCCWTSTTSSGVLALYRTAAFMATLLCALFLRDQEAADGEVREARTFEGVHRVRRRAHQGLAVQVERGVEHRADPGARLELPQHAVVAGVPGLVHQVGARGEVVGMERGHDLVAAFRVGREREHHVGRREPLGVHEVIGQIG